ncbi:kinase-like domain-containing protein [Rhizophagus clarus]|uniref:Kinase-like domain-containing protein n=1 Tax=Rhizophagus clarus TaxID=94130 RepID=A0A8H3QQ72_9GLOM|nr:kinase-like domain-containing protein [Rhizophagus clarus]
MEKKPKYLWKYVNPNKYQLHVTNSKPTTKSEDSDEKIVYMEDLEKRKQVYGICGECNEPEGGFGKVYSAGWSEGHIKYWDIENQIWCRDNWDKYALKSLNDSSDISSNFLNEITSHLQIYLYDVINCYGITQHPDTKEYMMVLNFCNKGNLRNYINKSKKYISYKTKIGYLQKIARGLSDIHNAEKVHKDFHSAIKICNGLRPDISKDIPKLLVDLIIKCWDAEIENRPTAKELYQLLTKWNNELQNVKNVEDRKSNEICSQVDEYDEIGEKKFKSRSNEDDKSKNIQTHPQAIYTSRLLNFNNLPKPVNSSTFQFDSANPVSVQLDESDLDEFWQQ